MKLETSIIVASLAWKAAAQVTAVSDCHLHGTQVHCLSGATEYIVATTATATSELPAAYTGCHAHGTDTFCLTPSGDDVEIRLEGDDDDGETGEEPQGEHCHFHAGVEHCVGGSGESNPKTCDRKDREYNIPLRIGLLFVILVTSALGVFAPIFLARYLPSTANSVLVVVKQFGTGVIISTSLVHLLTHAQLMFGNECLGGLAYEATAAAIAMAGLFLSFLTEYLGHRFLKRTADGASPVKAAIMSVYVLEAGIIFHSLIIGLTLVVSGDSFLLTLFVVILFHQMFEGLALGICIASASSGLQHYTPHSHSHGTTIALPTTEHMEDKGDAQGGGISMTRKLLLASAFALVTPVGMAIGIGVLNQFNGNDPQTIIAIGVLDALSAGVLLWVGIVEMWAADWTAGGGALVDAGWVTTVMGLGGLVTGMVGMSVLGKWA